MTIGYANWQKALQQCSIKERQTISVTFIIGSRKWLSISAIFVKKHYVYLLIFSQRLLSGCYNNSTPVRLSRCHGSICSLSTIALPPLSHPLAVISLTDNLASPTVTHGKRQHTCCARATACHFSPSHHVSDFARRVPPTTAKK